MNILARTPYSKGRSTVDPEDSHQCNVCTGEYDGGVVVEYKHTCENPLSKNRISPHSSSFWTGENCGHTPSSICFAQMKWNRHTPIEMRLHKSS